MALLDAADGEEYIRRVVPFVTALPDCQQRQHEMLSQEAKRCFASAHVIPNNAAIVILSGAGALAPKLDALEAIHISLNSFNERICARTGAWLAEIHARAPSISTTHLLTVAEQWRRHTELGNHYLGPRLAGVIFRGADELGLDFTEIRRCAEEGAAALDPHMFSIAKASVRISPSGLAQLLRRIGEAPSATVERIEIQKITPGREGEPLSVGVFGADVRPLATLAPALDGVSGLAPAGGSYLYALTPSAAISQGYAGLKQFLALGGCIDHHYDSATGHALQHGSIDRL